MEKLTIHIKKDDRCFKKGTKFSLDLVPGDVNFIVGPNGSGKTTLIHYIRAMRHDLSDINRELHDGMSNQEDRLYSKEIGKLYEVTVVYHPKLYDQIQELNEKWKKEKKKEIRYATESYCYISKVTEEELSTVREGFASCEIKIRDKKVHPHVMARKWVDTTPKEKKEKKPTVNTAEVKREAKTKRKSFKLEQVKMRPYYAARRKGGVSKRLSKKNPKLAAAIAEWLKEHPATTTRKNRGTGVSAKYKKGVTHNTKGMKRATLASIKTKKRTNLKKAA